MAYRLVGEYDISQYLIITISQAIYTAGEEDHLEIVQELSPIACKWRKIGFALGLSANTLDNIQHRYHDLDDQLRSMVSEWLKKNYNFERHGVPTWDKLVGAVGRRVGGRDSSLAQRIAERHHGNHTESDV